MNQYSEHLPWPASHPYLDMILEATAPLHQSIVGLYVIYIHTHKMLHFEWPQLYQLHCNNCQSPTGNDNRLSSHYRTNGKEKLIESSFLLDVKKLEVIVAQQNYIQLKEIVMIIIASTYTSNKTILSGWDSTS